tara:strand:+ start:19 stop:324 length:306 start_codon:yes stop_codon:yes gene_type:complete
MNANTLEIASILSEIETYQDLTTDQVRPVGATLTIEFIKRDGSIRLLTVDNVDGLPFLEIKDNNNVLVQENDAFRMFDLTMVTELQFANQVYTNDDLKEVK